MGEGAGQWREGLDTRAAGYQSNKDEDKKQIKNVTTDSVFKLKHPLHFSVVLIWTQFQMFKIVKCEKLK